MSLNPLITIVVGGDCTTAASIRPCLDSIAEQTASLEVQVVIAATENTDLIEEENEGWEVINMRRLKNKLVPELWGIALKEARAPVVAITSANCIPSKNWVNHILNSFNADANLQAIGGPIQPPMGSSFASWAVYFARYSAFLPPITSRTVEDLAGDNAAYRLDTLNRFWSNRQDGFWETLFHRNLRTNNIDLLMSDEIPVQMGNVVNPIAFARSRFQHGKHYGFTRSEQSRICLIWRVLTAPLLVPYLTARCTIRILRKRIDLIPIFCISSFWFIFFQSAWSAGEVRGYLCQLENR
jgi:hypothetical protein